ncbi:MAG: hypothetical protein Kow0056_06710 [Coriobacteriia bacterium]
MQTTSASRVRLAAATAVLLLVALPLALTSGCAEDTSGASGQDAAASDRVGEPFIPPAPDLSTPEAAVRSYLDWTSLAYRMANSEAASAVVTPWEEVRVDSYIQYNREQGRGIEQFLTRFDITSVAVEEPTATVTAYEEWRYRYFSLDSLEYLGPEHTAKYDTTYTVVWTEDRWLVDSVEAEALGPVE